MKVSLSPLVCEHPVVLGGSGKLRNYDMGEVVISAYY